MNDLTGLEWFFATRGTDLRVLAKQNGRLYGIPDGLTYQAADRIYDKMQAGEFIKRIAIGRRITTEAKWLNGIEGYRAFNERLTRIEYRGDKIFKLEKRISTSYLFFFIVSRLQSDK